MDTTTYEQYDMTSNCTQATQLYEITTDDYLNEKKQPKINHKHRKFSQVTATMNSLAALSKNQSETTRFMVML